MLCYLSNIGWHQEFFLLRVTIIAIEFFSKTSILLLMAVNDIAYFVKIIKLLYQALT